ncbi:MAG TPA: hypothetical protein EYP56_05970, partial [Planctomycetaceae bacterium]|nr:hypothetical protein [Planctomycetaceae bacterium]
MFDPALFLRSADLRGEYPRQINEELAWFVGRYLVRYLEQHGGAHPAIVVGRDGRHSSPSVYRALVQGIAAAGGRPIPAGLATTDMILWAAGEGLAGASAGAMVTASHNPPEYNGIKAVRRGSVGVETIRPKTHLRPIYEADMASDAPVIAETPSPAAFPASARLGLATRFVEAACGRAPDRGQLTGTVVLDPGNGVGSLFIEPLKKQLPGVRIESIFEQIDGDFPNRPSNPGLPGATKTLQEEVRRLGAAFGAAFDGDADRVFLVDEQGRFVAGDHVLAALVRVMLAREAEKQNRGHGLGPVVFASTCSWL